MASLSMLACHAARVETEGERAASMDERAERIGKKGKEAGRKGTENEGGALSVD